MRREKLAIYIEAIPKLKNTGTALVGPCPNCGQDTLRLVELADGTMEESCTTGCKPDQIRDAVRVVLGAGKSPKNGKHPEKTTETTLTTETTEEPLGVSVVTPKARKPAEKLLELAPEAYYGLPGRVLRAIAPHTESHPAGILGSFLAAGGCFIGPGPHVFREGQRHACNEFILLLGKAGSGRKGTSTRRIEQLFRYLNDSESTNIDDVDMSGRAHGEPLSWDDLTVRGLGSGEALVAALAEDEHSDPRRMVFEAEFARCLKVMAREGSTLSDVLKAAWDSEPMQVRTKGSTLTASQSHVSVLTHVTESDLRRRLSDTELLNGFANRFLWMGTRRVQSLPFGGGEVGTAPLVSEMHAALRHRVWLGKMEFDADAAAIWDPGHVYDKLNETAPGLLGSLSDRAAPHVTRVALQYAVWDRSKEIRVPHLLAGLAVWDYSFQTCAALFGRSFGDDCADLIAEKLEEVHPGFLTRKEIRDLFARNAAPGRIPAALDLLEELEVIQRGKMQTGGHPTEIVSLARLQRYDRNDQSPLQVARAEANRLGYTTETT